MYRICIPCQPFLRIYSLEKLRLKISILLCFGTIGCLSEGDTTKQLAESAAEQNVTITNTMLPNADALAMADLNTVTITIVNMAGIKQTSVQIKKNGSDILFKDFLKLCQENSEDIDFSQLNPKYYQNLNKWL